MAGKRLLAVLLLSSMTGPAFAQLADEMTCKQAIAYYEKHGVIQVLANGKFAVPVRVGVPVSKASTLQCDGEGQPRPYTISTSDAWRCTIAVTC
ncbi:hypothetical protein [Aquibium sp. ELW1220]|uniref:hypothetical protein n=1 Tax=Aquibium sp. ELW1220 TaxID=2976766 RepID=UPI0025AFC25B|nr:hypothetical protein [Aquibium sp. ELW1220]MDN2578701.1 hypothetical protein [Aquibium sp. ELW1220]